MDTSPAFPPPFETAPTEGSSLFVRLTNVYAAPGELFDEVKASPVKTSNWLVPVILACIAIVTFNLALFSQEGIVRELRETQERAMQKQVAAGAQLQVTGAAVTGRARSNAPESAWAFPALVRGRAPPLRRAGRRGRPS